jgi:hypothetical protein
MHFTYTAPLQRIRAVHKGTALLVHRIKAMHSESGEISGSIF